MKQPIVQQSTGFVRIEQSGSTAVITLARPERRNAILPSMYAVMADALRAWQADESVHVVLVRGEGRDFCAGNDIGDFYDFGSRVETSGLDPLSMADRKTPSVDLVHVLLEIDKPLIACIQGNAIGFGATFLLHCDVVVAEPDARLRFPFVDLALVPEAGCSLLLRERVGFLKAAEILYTGAWVDAVEAKALGLVTEVTAQGTAMARAQQWAELLASKPPSALRATKRLLRRDAEPLSERIMEEFRTIAERISSAEAHAVFARMLGKAK